MPGGGCEFGDELATHERIAMRLGRGDEAEGQREKPIPGQNGRRLVERFCSEGLLRRMSSSSSGKIVMHQRIGMQAPPLQRPGQRAPVDAEQLGSAAHESAQLACPSSHSAWLQQLRLRTSWLGSKASSVASTKGASAKRFLRARDS